MNKIFIVLASLALFSAHVARGDDAPAAPVTPASETATCTSDKGTFNSGDRYCSSETTSRVCAYGTWYDFQCDPDSKCMQSQDGKQVLCRRYVKNPPWPTGPSESDKSKSRERRQANNTAPDTGAAAAPSKPETCTSDRGTFNTGDRYCASETTSRVCSYGDWVDFQCDPDSKCLENKDLKQVLCRKIVKNAPWPTGPSGSDNNDNGIQNNQVQSNPSRARRDVAPQDKTCTSERGSLRNGDRYCSSKTTSSLCAYGELYHYDCPPNSECLEGQDRQQGVLCREYHLNPRNRRQSNDTGSEEKSCTTPDRGTFQHGDRYCATESTHRVCSFGTWFDAECPADSKCKENKALRQVLCRQIVKNAPWPTGPSGSDDNAQQQQQQQPQRR